jgi:hypothetical protein
MSAMSEPRHSRGVGTLRAGTAPVRGPGSLTFTPQGGDSGSHEARMAAANAWQKTAEKVTAIPNL